MAWIGVCRTDTKPRRTRVHKIASGMLYDLTLVFAYEEDRINWCSRYREDDPCQ